MLKRDTKSFCCDIDLIKQIFIAPVHQVDGCTISLWHHRQYDSYRARFRYTGHCRFKTKSGLITCREQRCRRRYRTTMASAPNFLPFSKFYIFFFSIPISEAQCSEQLVTKRVLQDDQPTSPFLTFYLSSHDSFFWAVRLISLRMRYHWPICHPI
jgi:hypothetical protein